MQTSVSLIFFFFAGHWQKENLDKKIQILVKDLFYSKSSQRKEFLMIFLNKIFQAAEQKEIIYAERDNFTQ